MKRSFSLWQLIGFALSTLGGTLLHFLYDFSEGSVFVAPFSGVNESTFEHMKLLFWPMFTFAIIESFFFRDYKGFWCTKLRGTLLGIGLIPILFYTYNGVIGKSPDWINISIFFISAAIAFLYETRKYSSERNPCRHPKASFATICIIALLFILFTFKTPKIGIFKDPLSGMYGIPRN